MLPFRDIRSDGFGLDVEPIARWNRLVADEVGWARLCRTFSVAERGEIERSDDVVRTAAGRWVVKEAVVKALPAGLGLRDVEVLRGSDGALMVTRPSLPGTTIHVSVSHTAEHVFGAALVMGTRGRQGC